MDAETRFHSCISLHFLLFYVDGGGERKEIEGMVVGIVGIEGKLGSGDRAEAMVAALFLAKTVIVEDDELLDRHQCRKASVLQIRLR
ncbi:hypothetical protein V6N12_024768 [Hibiscus sabdariffa]|uniref:Uncharacterized protein n=1 Tax=Hibiscus sabdariffa TaxID=183260 RepID=A0ABR2BA27_9ROSI